MSKHETPMTVGYWNQTGGTLIEEFVAVNRGANHGYRLLDAVILPDGPKRRISGRSEKRGVDVKGQRAIIVQAKASRLGMYLLGQALFLKHLVEALGASEVRTVALCAKDDSVLRPLAEKYGIEVVVWP